METALTYALYLAKLVLCITPDVKTNAMRDTTGTCSSCPEFNYYHNEHRGDGEAAARR